MIFRLTKRKTNELSSWQETIAIANQLNADEMSYLTGGITPLVTWEVREWMLFSKKEDKFNLRDHAHQSNH